MKTKTIIICIYLYFVVLSLLWIEYLTPADPIHFQFYAGWFYVLTAPWSTLYEKILGTGYSMATLSSPLFGVAISFDIGIVISFCGALINCVLIYFIFKSQPRKDVNKKNVWAPIIWALTLGALGLGCGFYGPALLNPGANQGSLLGLFVTGPFSLLLGAVLGLRLRDRGIKRQQNFYFLGITSFIVAAATLYMSLPPDRLIGFVIEAEIEDCKDPMVFVPSRSNLLRWQKGPENWQLPPPEWNKSIQKMVDRDKGVVLQLFVLNEGKIFVQQKPWNKGKKTVKDWHRVNDMKAFYANFSGSICSDYLTEKGRELFQYSELEALKVSPPDRLPQFLGFNLINEMPNNNGFVPFKPPPTWSCASTTASPQPPPKNYIIAGPARDVTPLLLKAFEKVYGKKKLSEIRYEHLLFSPMGNFIAVSISQITSGDAEQIWIVDLKSNESRLITERVIEKKVGLHIRKVCWESEGTLIATVDRMDWLNQSNNRSMFIRWTTDKTETETISNRRRKGYISYLSPSHRLEIKQFAPNSVELVDLARKKVLFQNENKYWDHVAWVNDDIFMFVEGLGHGSFTLNVGEVQPKAKTFRIDSGSWELLKYAVNPLGPQIAYAKQLDGQNYAIIIYDLVTKSEIKSIFIRQWPSSLVWSSTNQLAFTAKSCEVASEKFSRPSNTVGDSTHKLCVLQLLDGTKQGIQGHK